MIVTDCGIFVTFGGYGVLFVMEWAISVTNDASGAGFVTNSGDSVTFSKSLSGILRHLE